MAILITVIHCDNCEKIAGNKTDQDWREFERTWFEGLHFQFCPDCKKLPETLERRQKDFQMNEAVIIRHTEKAKEVEYVH